MTAVKPAPAVVICDGCRHAARFHGATGCTRGDCWCTYTAAEVNGATPAAPVADLTPLSEAAFDLLDPLCACGHRRGQHHPAGGSGRSRRFKGEHTVALACDRCACRNFAPEVADATPAAPPAEPAPAPAVPAAEARAEAEQPAEPAPLELTPARAPRRPRRRRNSDEERTGVPVGGADQGVTAAASPSVAVTPAPAVDAVLDMALWLSARWYCPDCIQWPHDPGACATCGHPLQPVYLVTLRRELP